MPLARSVNERNTAIVPVSLAYPSWLPARGAWGTVPGGSLSASGVMESGAGSIITAWGDAILNYHGLYIGSTFVNGSFLILWGGGHGDYGGNEYYALGPLEIDSPQWYKPRASTSPAPDSVSEDGGGNPVSRHSFGSLVYVGPRNQMFTIGGAGRHSDALDDAFVHVLDFNSPSPNTTKPWITKSVPGITLWQAAYESLSDSIFGIPIAGSNVVAYDCTADSTSIGNFKNPFGQTSGGACAMDTKRRIFALWCAGSGTGMQFYDCRSGTSNDYYVPSVTGTPPGPGIAGIVYDEVLDCFVFWPNNGAQLFRLTPPPGGNPYAGGDSWAWSNSTPGGTAPSASTTNGVNGRFGLSPSQVVRGYFVLNSPTESVSFYRS